MLLPYAKTNASERGKQPETAGRENQIPVRPQKLPASKGRNGAAHHLRRGLFAAYITKPPPN